MGLERWDIDDDEDVQSYRRRTRFDTAFTFLNEAINALEEDTPESEEATDLPKQQELGG